MVVPLILLAGTAPAAGRPGSPDPSAPAPVREPSHRPGWTSGEPSAPTGAASPVAARSGGSAAARVADSATGLWPLAPRPRVVARFSPPQVRWSSGHRGVDLAGRLGQPVVASRDGVVRHAGSLAGRGVVSVAHDDGTRTTYEPLLVDVTRGDEVRAGDRIGWLVATGSHCAPAVCLHWGWRRDEEYLDPLTLAGATPVRLLPLAGEPVGGR